MTENKKTERIAGLDLIKILACFGVVALHTLRPGAGPVHRILMLLSALSIPLFFMVSGYLMFQRKSFDCKYAIGKILRILAICFCWEFLHAAAYRIYYGENRDFISSFFLDFFQKGLFYHFWYLGALILVYSVMPLIFTLAKKSPGGCRILLLILCGINLILSAAQLLAQRQFLLDIPQNLRIWIWLLYTVAGGCLSLSTGRTHSHPCRVWACCIFPVLMVGYLALVGKTVFGSTVIESMYGSLFVQLAAMSAFLCLSRISFSEKATAALTSLAGLTMGIYIVHPFLLAILQKFIPAFVQGSSQMNLLFWITTLFVSAAAALVIRKMPLIRLLIRL